jgi:hypothetical protein
MKKYRIIMESPSGIAEKDYEAETLHAAKLSALAELAEGGEIISILGPMSEESL